MFCGMIRTMTARDKWPVGSDGPAVAERLGASCDAVWRVLRREGICLARQRSWCGSMPRGRPGFYGLDVTGEPAASPTCDR